MTRLICGVKISWRTLLLGFMVMGYWFLPSTAQGNGGGVFMVHTEGNYEIRVLSSPMQPKIGVWHLTFHVLDRSPKRPIPDASIDLIAVPPAIDVADEGFSNEVRVFHASASATENGVYDMNVQLDEVGFWDMEVSIQAPGITGNDIRLHLPEVRVVEGGINAVTVAVIAALLPTLIGVSWIASRWAKRGRRVKSNHFLAGKQ